MPIDYQIVRERRLVTARARGTVTDLDPFDFQESVWFRPEVLGFNVLVAKDAIVAPDRLALGLGRRCEIYRNLEAGSKKEACASRTLLEAKEFLGVDLPPESLS